MKKIIAVCSVFVLVGSVFATSTDNELIDALDKLETSKTAQELTTLQADLAFETFSSCDDMTTVLEDFVKDNFKGSGYGRGGGWIEPFMVDDVAMDMAEESAPTMALKSSNQAFDGDETVSTVGSSTNDFSTTNLQVEGVDEADIIKTDGDYIYYYNERQHSISILRSPLDIASATIALADAEVVSVINIPETFWGTEMYIHDNKLVLLAQRWREGRQQTFLDRNSRTDVVVYDIANVTDPELLKLSDLDGSYHDSRMIGGTLYVVSQLHVNRWYPGQYYEDLEDIDLDIQDILPKTIDIAYTTEVDKRNLTIANTNFPYRVSVERPDCRSINYVLPSQESIEQFGLYPSFSIVRAIDLGATDEAPTTATSFGSTQTIHMSQDNVYLTSPLYVSRVFSCPINARCILPWYEGGQHTLIHKFGIDAADVEYVASNLVSGSPLTQYSMSEDSRGNFRILTSSWNPTTATHLFVLDDDLDLEGMLLNIEPGEEFKSSRYIGDKLYLVTFERTDPLFVIDLDNTSKPEIIGELKIPGFSTYLHPYGPAADGKQYLIGLGYGTEENQWGGIVTKGIKVDLYEIDYTSKDDKGLVSTKQLYTETWGERNSYSEALENPRMFVRDEKRQLLVLPMILSDTEKAQNCNIQYDGEGNEISRECRDNEKVDTIFAGLKALEVDVDTGINEKYSYDFLDMLKDDKQVYESWDGSIYPWQFSQLHFRVGYLGDALYTLNNLFAHFAIMGSDDEAFVSLDK